MFQMPIFKIFVIEIDIPWLEKIRRYRLTCRETHFLSNCAENLSPRKDPVCFYMRKLLLINHGVGNSYIILLKDGTPSFK